MGVIIFRLTAYLYVSTCAAAQSPDTFKILTEAIADPIACGAIDDKFLFVARKSG